MTDEEKIEAWDALVELWTSYSESGDPEWDDESRRLMRQLTGQRVEYWYKIGEGEEIPYCVIDGI